MSIQETWQLYKTHVVDFLLRECGLEEDGYNEDEIFHVLGAIDVNSVKINCLRSQQMRAGQRSVN